MSPGRVSARAGPHRRPIRAGREPRVRAVSGRVLRWDAARARPRASAQRAVCDGTGRGSHGAPPVGPTASDERELVHRRRLSHRGTRGRLPQRVRKDRTA
jgi:hypothetical protein